MTRRVVEKVCTKKVCVDFWPLIRVWCLGWGSKAVVTVFAEV